MTASRHQPAAGRAGALPPGQRAVERLPRFGTQLHHPAPQVPVGPRLSVSSAGEVVLDLPVEELMGRLPRRELVSDLHCVAGWSAVGLRWEGVSFADLWRRHVQPALPAAAAASPVVVVGLDGYRIVVVLEDLLSDDVLLADRLDGRPLTGDHGAPLRLISPNQYAYVSAKHVCRIEVHQTEPRENFGAGSALSRALMLRPLFSRHPRSRVWLEERNGTLPNRVVRPVYRLLTPPLRLLNRLGARDGAGSRGDPRG